REEDGLPTGENIFSFSSGGGTLLILVSGSGFRDSSGQIGMNIYLDRNVVATASVWTNEPGSHKAFVCNPVVLKGIAQGNHLLYVKSWPSTFTDQNDLFSLTILEFPF
ncbi:MAG TPA: hypothetical protein VL134_12295, partial [Leptolyngbya sp.]|nr:hypothetical protein [Leptolyngbya sp.]